MGKGGLHQLWQISWTSCLWTSNLVTDLIRLEVATLSCGNLSQNPSVTQPGILGNHSHCGKKHPCRSPLVRNPWIVTLEDVIDMGRENSPSFKSLAGELWASKAELILPSTLPQGWQTWGVEKGRHVDDMCQANTHCPGWGTVSKICQMPWWTDMHLYSAHREGKALKQAQIMQSALIATSSNLKTPCM